SHLDVGWIDLHHRFFRKNITALDQLKRTMREDVYVSKIIFATRDRFESIIDHRGMSGCNPKFPDPVALLELRRQFIDHAHPYGKRIKIFQFDADGILIANAEAFRCYS